MAIDLSKVSLLEHIKYIYGDLRDRMKEKYTKPVGGIPASDLADGVIPDVPVQDVQVAGTSILENGVANLPLATNSTNGVLHPQTDRGLSVGSTGILSVYSASSNEIKAGTQTYKPIVPNKQNESIFYGLAKLAGFDLANETVTLGTYPDAALQAIQKLFGMIGILGPYEDDITADQGYAIGETFVMNGKRYKATAAIAQGGIITPGTNCELQPLDGNYVKFTDIANTLSAGVFKMDSSDYGLQMSGNGTLRTKKATDSNIKNGGNSFQPIVPANQHISAFYALAKLAGVDLASSDTPVGTYTAEAKAAILAMLGAVGENDIATSSALGLVQPRGNAGIYVTAQGNLCTDKSTINGIKAGTNVYNPIVPELVYAAVYYGLAKAAGADMASLTGETVGVYPQAQKTAIQNMLGIEADIPLVETVSGSTPTITGMPNVRYICDTCSLLTITPPASGSIVVRFSSGSTPTVLTVPNTVKFPAWFDYTALEANTTYELIITDGVYGGVMAWAD